jgi:hypothetical protein
MTASCMHHCFSFHFKILINNDHQWN